MTDRPKWNGGFAAARRIADDMISDHLDAPGLLVDLIAEALVEAYDDGVLAEHNAREDPEMKRVIFTKLLREEGIGIATLNGMKTRTTAIARGELKPTPDEPKLWFSSIESVIESLRTMGGDHDDGDVELYEEYIRARRPTPEKE